MQKIIIFIFLISTGCCTQPIDLNLDGYVDVDFEQTDELE